MPVDDEIGRRGFGFSDRHTDQETLAVRGDANAPPSTPGRMQTGPPLPGSFTLMMIGKQ